MNTREVWSVRSPGRAIAVATGAVLTAEALVVVLLPFRERIDALSVGWAFLAVVIVAAALGGLWPGVLASVVGFVAYNYFFLPPYHTFRVAQPEHLVVLCVFLGLSLLIAWLLAVARSRAAAAEARAAELLLQQDLAMALVDPAADDDAYLMVLRLMATRLHLDRVDLYVMGADGSGLAPVASTGTVPPSIEGSTEEAEGVVRVPLIVGRRSAGLLVVRADPGVLGPGERRILGAFADQLSLVLERDRLLRRTVDLQRLRAVR
jgi:two-component system sensor histidine kinase KdpD